MLRMRSSVMSGRVCVLGGSFLMSLMIIFCVLIRGCMYVFLWSDVPPDGDVADEVWVDMCEVDVSQDVCW